MDANNDDEMTNASKIEVEDTQEKEQSMKTEISVSPRARNMSPDRSLSVSPCDADITIKGMCLSEMVYTRIKSQAL